MESRRSAYCCFRAGRGRSDLVDSMLAELIFEAVDNSEPSESTSSAVASDESRFFMLLWYLSSNALIWTFSMLVRLGVVIVVRRERLALGALLSRMIGRRGLSLRFTLDEDRLTIDWRERGSTADGGSSDRSLIIKSDWSKLCWETKDLSCDDCRCRRSFNCVAFSRSSCETEDKREKTLASQGPDNTNLSLDWYATVP